MKAVTRWVFVACVAISGSAHGQGDGAKIRFKPWSVPGRYQMTIRTNTNQELTVNEEMQPKQRMEHLLEAEVNVGAPGAGADREITMSFVRIKQVVKKGSQSLAYDSADPKSKQDSPLANALKPMLKVKLTITIGADGKVKKVTGFDEIWAEMAKKDPKAAEVIKDMQKQMGDTMAKALIDKSLALVPAEGISVGQQWSKKVKMPIPFFGEANTVQNCTLTKVVQTDAGPVAVIDYKGEVTLPAGAKANIGEVSLTASRFAVDQEGQIQLNLDAGITSASELKQTATIEMTGKDSKGRDVKILIEQDGTTSISMRPVPAAATTQPAK